MKGLIDFFENHKGAISFLTTVCLFVIGFLINRRARRIQRLMVFKEFREPLIKFANEAIDSMSELEGLCECDPKILGKDFYNRYNKILIEISALRDKGKLFIPNNLPERYGQEKAEAYKGFRHEVLDCLTAAYYIATSINFYDVGYNKKSVDLKECKFILLEKNSLDSDSEDLKLLKQAQKIKMGLDKLPIPNNKHKERYLLEGPKDKVGISNGWSSKKAIVETKRRFVSSVQDLIKTRYWGEKLKELSNQETD